MLPFTLQFVMSGNCLRKLETGNYGKTSENLKFLTRKVSAMISDARIAISLNFTIL